MSNGTLSTRAEFQSPFPTPLAPCIPVKTEAVSVPRILVVDDETDIRELNVLVLTQSGYQVDGVGDGAAGWQALHLTHYDLLITDNSMPVLSGMDLVKKLRSAKMTIPVILASGTSTASEANLKKQLQVSAKLQKPYAMQSLVDTVNTVLGVSDTTSASQ